jgi:hypothetical protein
VTLARRLWPAVAAAFAVAAAGCGLGPGPSTEGVATLTVTRDYGATPMLEATVDDPSESETVVRFLDREAEITTGYGGNFVQSIEGIAGEYRDGRSLDWFFYVDGLWSPVGSAEREVSAGQRIWWDYHDWTDATRVPAVVGSWPEPFAQAAADDPLPVRIECRTAPAPCEAAQDSLAGEGVEAEIGGGGEDGPELRLLVGPWRAIRDDPAAGLLDGGPAASGVFAQFRGVELAALDVEGKPASTYRDGAGLVAAVREGEDPPTWVATGTDAAGVDAAVGVLDSEQLEHRYAALATDTEISSLPVLR